MTSIRSLGPLVVVTLALLGAGCSTAATDDTTARDDSGTIVGEGEVGAFRLQVGDCLSGAGIGEVESVQGVPCDDEHELEVYHAFDLPEGDGSYPGATTVDDLSTNGCYDAFSAFVGLGYEESIYDFTSLQPTSASWDQLDDREVLCLIGNGDGTLKTGSARGAAR